MRWATVLLVIVWLGIAAGVTVWALRARRDHRIDLSGPETVPVDARIDLTDDRDERTRRP